MVIRKETDLAFSVSLSY